ncbi:MULTISPECIES: type 1 glutamine amidotransferase domain-containing protein [Shouchella]|uniref:Type 1 glutamine amidotransferase domain-containing protein n=2 Tax=Shouchella TaxID=2893057 RepID=A0ABY7W9V7_9BACI|nr:MULTISPECIES: type 1 glutamine amidotransferase domain-containing protein [Shouchella]MED4129131.1 type 1 glutamine amidotransferase domain-containing protein [Shouchella miscanthi]WDF05674.1 type 1 glutamine amidotransferase domain-containing protein [Shouchella hunanensis]GAF20596.1 ThiJ/PfpI family protein [Bacillus sp. JCM 19047]
MSKKILVVVSSHPKYPGLNRATGLWLGEAVHFVDKVEQAGYEVDYVSPLGGYTPIDPHSLAEAEEIDWKYYQNPDFMKRLGSTLKPSEINANDYGVIYYAGGHGTIWDFPENEELQQISQAIYSNGGIISSVCHGAVGLLNIKTVDGAYLVEGKTVTGFTNEEEKMAELDQYVPYLTETELINRGANFQKANAFEPYAVEDGRLVTGQNPASGGPVADLVIKQLLK